MLHLPLINPINYMQEFKKYHYDSAVLEAFNPRGLVIAKSRMSTKAGFIHAPERLPAGKLFAGRTMLPVANGFQLLDKSGPAAFIEDSSNDGSKYRFYNHPDKTKATVTLCLVTGDPTIELVEVNPCFTVEPKANGLVTIHNTSIINGKPWQEFDPVAYARSLRQAIPGSSIGLNINTSYSVPSDLERKL